MRIVRSADEFFRLTRAVDGDAWHSRPLLGLDIGARCTGVAVCGGEQRTAAPLCQLVGRGTHVVQDRAWHTFLAHAHGACGWVVGNPLTLGGQAGPAAVDVFRTLLVLTDRYRLQPRAVYLHDERYSSQMARRLKGNVHANAACVLLQEYLDRINRARARARDA